MLGDNKRELAFLNMKVVRLKVQIALRNIEQ